MGILQRLRGIPRPVSVLIGLALVALVGFLDFLTPAEISFSIFYLIPVSFAALAAGRLVAFPICFLCAIVWLRADLYSGAHYSHWLTPYWNAGMRLGYFTLHATLLSILLDRIEYESLLARQDPLTGASNWRHFEEYAFRELARARREQHPITVAYMDLDNFKSVNDTLGHDIGDDILCAVAKAVTSHIRVTDMLARVGGDEFAIMLPGADYAAADAVLRRLREMTQSEIRRQGWPVTLSVGAVTFTAIPSGVDAMIRQVDDLMYSVKQQGKNNLKHTQWPAAGGQVGAERA